MRHSYLIPLCATLLLAGCDGLGGSADSFLEPSPVFEIINRSPGGGRGGVPVTASIVVDFTSDIDPATVRQGSVTANGLSFGTLTVDGRVLRFTPAGSLVPGTTYGIRVSSEIRGLNGVTLGPNPNWAFKTAGVPPVLDTLLAIGPRTR